MIKIEQLKAYARAKGLKFEEWGRYTSIKFINGRYYKGEEYSRYTIGINYFDHIWLWFDCYTEVIDESQHVVFYERYSQNTGKSQRGWKVGYDYTQKILSKLAGMTPANTPATESMVKVPVIEVVDKIEEIEKPKMFKVVKSDNKTIIYLGEDMHRQELKRNLKRNKMKFLAPKKHVSDADLSAKVHAAYMLKKLTDGKLVSLGEHKTIHRTINAAKVVVRQKLERTKFNTKPVVKASVLDVDESILVAAAEEAKFRAQIFETQQVILDIFAALKIAVRRVVNFAQNVILIDLDNASAFADAKQVLAANRFNGMVDFEAYKSANRIALQF